MRNVSYVDLRPNLWPSHPRRLFKRRASAVNERAAMPLRDGAGYNLDRNSQNKLGERVCWGSWLIPEVWHQTTGYPGLHPSY